MAFLLFRPAFWLLVGYTVVWNYYVDAGLAFDGVDKDYHYRPIRNATRSTTTEKWSDQESVSPSSSHTIFYATTGTWVNKFQLLTLMLISGMSPVAYDLS